MAAYKEGNTPRSLVPTDSWRLPALSTPFQPATTSQAPSAPNPPRSTGDTGWGIVISLNTLGCWVRGLTGQHIAMGSKTVRSYCPNLQMRSDGQTNMESYCPNLQVRNDGQTNVRSYCSNLQMRSDDQTTEKLND